MLAAEWPRIVMEKYLRAADDLARATEMAKWFEWEME